MKKLLYTIAFTGIAFLLGGCLVHPVDKSGGMGATTVTNSNVDAIIASAQTIFPNYGYTVGPTSYPNSISFDKPAGKFGKLAYGSYGVTTTVRARLSIIPIPGTNNFRISVKTAIVNDAGQAGFEDSRHMSGMWTGQFDPLLKQIQTQASNAGPGY
ncbi:MAG: hypothetical protein ABI443_05890 [Chthoniobacterales bacterium]